MTGFGRYGAEAEGLSIDIEIKSWNNKGCDVQMRLPEMLSAQEPAFRDLIARKAIRGKVSASLKVRGELVSEFRFNDALINSVISSFKEAALKAGISPTVSLSDIFAIPSAVEAVESKNDSIELLARQGLTEALLQWDQSRLVEGAKLSEAIDEQIGVLKAVIETIEERNITAVKEQQNRLRTRVLELVSHADVTVDEKRLELEIAMLAEKCDVKEEIVRLKSHLEAAIKLVRKKDDPVTPIGSEISFILQELLRETNTVGSKSQDLDTVKVVILGKTAIDRLKELAANVA